MNIAPDVPYVIRSVVENLGSAASALDVAVVTQFPGAPQSVVFERTVRMGSGPPPDALYTQAALATRELPIGRYQVHVAPNGWRVALEITSIADALDSHTVANIVFLSARLIELQASRFSFDGGAR